MAQPQKRYRHVIWDWNGTLLDDAWLCLEVINGMLQRRHMAPLTALRYADIFGFPVLDYYGKIGFDFGQDPFEVLSTEFISEYERRRSECPLQPGSSGVLSRLSESGIGQSIISSSQQIYLEEAVGAFGLTGMFNSLNGLDNHHAAGKLTIARQWLASSGVNPAQTLMIGDTLHDLETANAIGVDCVLIPSRHQSRSRLARGGVPLLGNLGEILSIRALALQP